ncbi:MAG: histidine kinase N-terminal 7TM domain-containing protein [Chloroflexi bacterium OHK40]
MAALPFVVLFSALAGTSGLLAAYAWSRRYYRSGRPLAMLMAAIGHWCLFRAMAFADPSFEGTLLWTLLQFGGITLIMPAWLLLALSYAGHWWRRHLALLGTIFLPATAFFLLALTNSLHGLWWTSVEPDTSRGFMWLQIDNGPLFWAHAAYAYACFGGGVGLLVHTALRAAPSERRQAWLMLAAAVLPSIGNIAFLAGLPLPWFDDPTPILLFVAGLVAFYATIHFRVVDLNPLVAREALAAFPDGMIVLDNQHQVAEINGVAALLFGAHPRTALGRPLAALLVGSPLGAAMRPVLGNLAQPSTHHVSYTDGSGEHTMEVRMRPLLAANGAMAGALLLLRDVSERARVEQNRAQHLAELSLISRVARAANTAADSAGLLRSVATAVAGAGIWERVAVGLLAPGARLDIVADIATDGDTTSAEGLQIGGPAGESLVELLYVGASRTLNRAEPAVASTPIGTLMAGAGLSRLLVVPLYHQGSPLGLLLLGSLAPGLEGPALSRVAETIGELITDAVVRTRLYEEARQADRLKASFLASVSHELRTPLTSIIGYVEMLQKGIYGQPGEAMREPLAFMRLSSATLLRMINDILDFSRAEAGHLRVELQPVNLLRAVANVVGQLQPQFSERGLSFELDLPPGLPLVQANAARLEQVLANLLSNAAKFTESGGVTVRGWQEGERVFLSVSDTGIGIAPENLDLIFQEFRRVEMPGRRVGGAGLGLAISKRLLELMGGSIRVASTPGVGSTFTIELSAATPAPLATDTLPQVPAERG